MTMHDPFARPDRDATLSLRLRLRLRLRRMRAARIRSGLRGLILRQAAREARRRRRGQRQLTAIDRRLAAEEPGLASLFVMFNQLAQGEQPAGEEKIPAPARPRPHPAQLVVLLALAAVTGLCLVLSSHGHTAAPRCLAGSPSASPAATAAYAGPLVPGLSCSAYAGNK